MFAIRSGWFCSAEFWWIEDALTKPKFAKLGSVQPMRQAKTAIHREIPAATSALNARFRKCITSSLYPSIPQRNLSWEIARDNWRGDRNGEPRAIPVVLKQF